MDLPTIKEGKKLVDEATILKSGGIVECKFEGMYILHVCVQWNI